MNRLLPARPVLSRWRRHVGAMPHGLPIALTFSVSVATLLVGSSLVVSGALPDWSPPDPGHALAAIDQSTRSRPSTSSRDETSTARARSTTAPSLQLSKAPTVTVVSNWSATSEGALVRIALSRAPEGLNDAPAPAPTPNGDQEQPGPTPSLAPGSEHGDYPSWPSPTPERDHHAPAPSPTPEEEHHAPAPSPTPERDHHAPAPSPTPEEEHHAPTPSPTPEEEHEHRSPTPSPTPGG